MQDVDGMNMNQTKDPNSRTGAVASLSTRDISRYPTAVIAPLWLMLLALFMAAPGMADDYRLGPGDVVSINVYDYPELLTETRVSDSGSITFPLIGEINVAGKSPSEVEKAITGALSSGGFIKHAQVHAKVQEFVSQKVSVIGEVKSPGKFSIQEAGRVTEAIALAGGINPDTGGDKAYVTRQADPTKKIEIDLHALLHADSSHDLPVLRGGHPSGAL
jgi:polysaccharide export outer membrane protein